MSLEDNTFPQSGDPDDSVRFAQLIGHGNILNHVETGLEVTADFDAGTASVDAGVCYISVESDTATSDSQEIRSLGFVVQVAADSVSLSSGENHIAVVPAYDENDTNVVSVFSSLSDVPDSALRIAVVDSTDETVTHYNRYPTASYESLSIQDGVSVNDGEDLLATEDWVTASISESVYTDADTVDAIDGEISEASGTISGLDTVVDANNSDIDVLISDVSSLESSKLDEVAYTPLDVVESEISQAANSISGLDSLVNTNDGDIDVLEDDVESLNSSVSDIDSTVDSNETDISNLQLDKLDESDYKPEADTHDRYTDAEALSSVEGEISESSTTVSELDVAVDTNEGNIGVLEDDVDGLNSSVSSLETTVDSNETDISNLQSDKLDELDYNPEEDTHDRYSDSEALGVVEEEISQASLSVSGLDSTVDSNETDISNLQSDKLDESDYNPEADTHDRYTDSEAISAVDGEISQSALTVSGLDSTVNSNEEDIDVLEDDVSLNESNINSLELDKADDPHGSDAHGSDSLHNDSVGHPSYSSKEDVPDIPTDHTVFVDGDLYIEDGT